jgi:hypothetical protein
MMTHIEGPIVDAFYDIFLISWSARLTPPLPCISNSLISTLPEDSPLTKYTFQEKNQYLANIELSKAAKFARHLLKKDNENAELESEEFTRERRETGEFSWENLRRAVSRKEVRDSLSGEVKEKRPKSFGEVVEEALKRKSAVNENKHDMKKIKEEVSNDVEMRMLSEKTSEATVSHKQEEEASPKIIVSQESKNESKDSVTLHSTCRIYLVR